MHKEIIIISIILIIVFGLDIITNRFVKESVSIMTYKLEKLEETILQEKLEDVKNSIEEAKRIWQSKYNVLAYYVEHDELEKVGLELASIDGNVKGDELGNAVDDINEAIFLLRHIEEKEQFDFRSIF